MELNHWLRPALSGSPFLTKLNYCFLGVAKATLKPWGHGWSLWKGTIRIPSTPDFSTDLLVLLIPWKAPHWIHSPEESWDPNLGLQRAHSHPEAAFPPHSTASHTTCNHILDDSGAHFYQRPPPWNKALQRAESSQTSPPLCLYRWTRFYLVLPWWNTIISRPSCSTEHETLILES